MVCRQAMEAKQLQKESMGRLNVMMDELRNSPSADHSAKNLGDEGTAYISEALAFNDRCAPTIRVVLFALRPSARPLHPTTGVPDYPSTAASLEHRRPTSCIF